MWYVEVVDAEHRLSALVHQLRAEGRLEVAQAARHYGTAEMTIRRDLDVLVRRGVARRVRGGAASLLARGDEIPYWMRELEAAPVKARIGRAISQLLRDGEAVGLDSGTTVLQVARSLGERRLTVLPVSLPTANALAEHPSVRIILAGGELRPGELSLTGAGTVAAIAAMRFDTVVLAPCGLGGGTLTAYDLGDAAIKRALRESARRVIVAADSSKFARDGMAVVCDIRDADVLVTDADAPTETVGALRAAGVDVLCV
jgi:DeoR/GlpR family transcriptional regulator of sugar metabolism